MPELPDVETYRACLSMRVVDRPLKKIHLLSPFVLRTVTPEASAFEGLDVREVRRLGKRIAFVCDQDFAIVIHLMIAGRFQWRENEKGAPSPKKTTLAMIEFEQGRLLLTEAGSKKRASIHLVQGEEELASHDPGGLEILEADEHEFRERLVADNHTVKRALTSPRSFSGVGNAYSDEILHRAGLSPLKWTQKLDEDEIRRLFEASREVLQEFTLRMREEIGDGFPTKVTAFRDDMAVHGKFGQPCPVCQSKVQRIVYASRETNYCATCQTEGRLLSDRALSRLLKNDWPKRLEE